MQPSFEQIHRDFGPSVARQVASHLPPGQDREDLIQDIWLAVWKAIPRFRGDSSIRTYVYRIVHNRAMTWLIRRRTPHQSEELGEIGDTLPSPEQVASSRQDVDRLMVAIRKLPPGGRQARILVLEGLSHGEIADILDLSPSAVAVRVHRARARLRASLGEPDGR